MEMPKWLEPLAGSGGSSPVFLGKIQELLVVLLVKTRTSNFRVPTTKATQGWKPVATTKNNAAAGSQEVFHDQSLCVAS